MSVSNEREARAMPDQASSVPLYAEVLVDARTKVPHETFTYAVPPHLSLRPGHLVRVPFGKRTLHGIVARITTELHVDYTKPVLGVLYPEPLLDETRMDLARWISRYYMAPLFDALAPMLPPGFRSHGGGLLHLVPAAAVPERLPEGAQRLLTYLQRHNRPLRLTSLVRAIGPWVSNAAQALINAGLLEEVPDVIQPLRRHRPAQVVSPAGAPEEMLAFADTLSRAPKQAALARKLAEPAAAPYLASTARNEFGAAAVSALAQKGFARITEIEVAPAATWPGQPESALIPTPEQAEAIAAINAAQDSPNAQPRSFLLQGVTGSGKTEVYLQTIARCLASGKRALMLVPELSLTPQTVQRFESRFPGNVGALHSGLTPGEHWRQWWDAREGRNGVVIGSRGAVFAPVPNLGLIVLDEEHEWTFKQTEALPRYHARDVALRLAELTGAVVVLGSATPDIGSAHAAEHGFHGLLRLPHRLESSGASGSMARVEIVDMRQELRSGNRDVFSAELRDALLDTLRNGKQALLFLNRRGAANVVECRNCGQTVKCWRCSIPYTYHAPAGNQGKGELLCHHCNRRRRMPLTCPNCKSNRIRYLGLGTQRLVEEVQELLPQARVLRWDRDAAPNTAAHTELLRRLASGEADVLVGTQMIAKGLDVPSVALVGVVLADVGLNFPDFRAPERTFQLLTQVAGRTGRGGMSGRVIIQTYQPENYAIQAAAAQNYDSFYAQEMAYRRAQDNPPFTKLVRLVFGHSEEETAKREALRFAGVLRRVMREWDMRSLDIIGPAPTYPPRVRGAWRWHLLIRGQDPRMLLDKVAIPPAWSVDIDPINVL